MPYIPHTKEETKAMLEAIQAPNIDSLFDEIPSTLKQHALQNIPEGLSEMEAMKHAKALADKNKTMLCFLGAGSYEHHIPAAVWDIASRGEFLTAYTPYQAEASQGTLQLLYEFQTMIAELTGMDVANASLYDGASSLAEAVLMAVRLKKKHQVHHVLIPESLHPHYRETLDTLLAPHDNIKRILLPIDSATGTTSLQALNDFEHQEVTALIIPSPNFFGNLEPYDAMADWAHAHQAISIACVNPMSLGLLKPPGMWGTHGVDITCGEGQPLGIPMAGGGPYLGLLSTKTAHVRQMPGRLVGKTEDSDGHTGYTLTLQAREQHIRREKATSNICTNQGLLVTVASIYLSMMGAEGMMRVAKTCHQNTNRLVQRLCALPGVSRVFSTTPFFHEALIQLTTPLAPIVEKLIEQGINPGLQVDKFYPQFQNTLLVCATECRTSEDIDKYVDTLQLLLQEPCA